MALSFDPDVALIVMPIPTVIAVAVAIKSIQLRRASTWVEGRARILASRSKRERRRFSGEATTVTNVAHVTYEFHVGDETIRGERVGIGNDPPDGVAATLRRFPVGADVPVYYDPRNPRSCVLDRSAPVSMGCLWSGAAVLLFLGAALTFAISSGGSIDESLSSAFPSVHHPLMALCIVAMGLLCLAMYVAFRWRARSARSWAVVPGTIVVSTTEVTTSDLGTRSRATRLHRARIEYAYQVDGHEYRGTRVDLGGEIATSSASKARAAAERYAVGSVVNVHYDPENPVESVLDPIAKGSAILIVIASVLFALAAFVAMRA